MTRAFLEQPKSYSALRESKLVLLIGVRVWSRVGSG